MRPAYLPDFANPPLNEVVLGVQFATPKGYQQLRAYEVWKLFSDNFPGLQELPPLPPNFETFGSRPGGVQFDFLQGPMPFRYWFLTKSGDELLQYQSDKLLHNWRKIGDGTNEYPRFERMIDNFERETRKLAAYFDASGYGSIKINQCEISYINHIYADSENASAREWLTYVGFNFPAENFVGNFTQVIKAPEGKPLARLYCEAQSAVGRDGRQMILLQISVKGPPADPSIEGAMKFLTYGREKIVHMFAEVTTEQAQHRWGRKS